MEIISDKDNPSNRKILQDIEKLNEEYSNICFGFTDAEYERYEKIYKFFVKVFYFQKQASDAHIDTELLGDVYKKLKGDLREKLKEFPGKTKKEKQLVCIKNYGS